MSLRLGPRPAIQIGAEETANTLSTGGRRYDPGAAALFALMTVQPDTTRKRLISDQFVAGKAKSFWAKLDALWVLAAHDAQAARLNWLADAYHCQPISNPTFTVDRGYMGDGSSSYLDTQFNPSSAVSAKFVRDSAAFGVRSNTNNANDGSLAGFFDGTKGVTINPRSAGSMFIGRINQAGASQVANGIGSSIGMFVVNRVAAADLRGYINATKVLTGTIGSTVIANGNLRLGSFGNSSFRACQLSLAFAGAGLTDAEVTDLFNWFEPYRTAVGVT